MRITLLLYLLLFAPLVFGFFDMALQKEYWEMLFGVAGQEQRIESKVVEAPLLSELINAEVIEPGALQKRTGYEALEASPNTSAGLDYGRKCERNGSLVSYADHKIAGYNENIEWGSRSITSSPTSTVKKLISHPRYTYSDADFVYIQQSDGSEYYVVCAKRSYEAGGTSFYDFVSLVFDTKQNLIRTDNIYSFLSGHTYSNLEMAVFGASQPYTIVYFWADNTNLKYKIVDTSDDFSLGTTGNITTDVATGSKISACTGGDKTQAYIAYNSSNYLKVISTNDGSSVYYSWDASGEGTPANYNANGAIAIAINENVIPATFICVAADMDHGFFDVFPWLIRFNSTLSSIADEVYSSSAAETCTGITLGTANGNYGFFAFLEVQYPSADELFDAVEVYYYTGAQLYPPGSGYGGVLENVSLRHRPIGTIANSRGPYFGVKTLIDNFSVEYTMQLWNYDDQSSPQKVVAEPIAKYQYRMTSGIAQGSIDGASNPNVREIDTDQFAWASCDVDGNVVLCFYDFRHPIQKRFHAISYKETLFMAQSIPLLFDAARSKEMGFSTPPVIGDYTISAGTGSIAAGDYNYIAVYTQTDNQGGLYRSQISAPVSINFASGSSAIDIRICGSPQRIGWNGTYLSSHVYPFIELYRTEEGPGSVYYKVNQQDWDGQISRGAWFSMLNADFFHEYKDTLSDADLIQNEPLYVGSGELEHCAPPPLDWITLHNNRLWGIDSETGGIVYSAELIEGEGPWFNPAMVVEGETDAQKPVAHVSSPTGLYVFWRKKIGIVYGEGANRLGVGSSLSRAQTIVDNIGCKEANSVIQTPKGILFKDDRGFHLLGFDSAEPKYIGGGVCDYDSQIISSASLVQDKKQVRFTLHGPTYYGILVYNYEYDQWSYWGATNSGSAESPVFLDERYGGCVIDNVHYIGLSNGNTLVQSTDGYVDGYINATPAYATTQYGMVVQTAWIKLAGLQGFKRVLRGWILGEYIDDHDLDIYIDYDYNEDNRDTVSFSNSELDSLSPYQVRFGIPRQRCEAIRFRIVVDTRSYTANAGAKLTALRLEYMRQPGGMRSVKRS